MNQLVDKLPSWYCGHVLHRARVITIPNNELSGHELDEIIDEKLTNPELGWSCWNRLRPGRQHKYVEGQAVGMECTKNSIRTSFS